MIRLATAADAPAIREIYRPFIEESAISFETEVPSVAEVAQRISSTLEKFPWLVWDENGAISGYAYAGVFRQRLAYAWSVEASVYVQKDLHGRGIGKSLYRELFRRLEGQGVVNIVGGITLPNDPSVALHESLGFVPVARFKAIGFKFGRWWDVGFWQLQLAKPTEPQPIRPY